MSTIRIFTYIIRLNTETIIKQNFFEKYQICFLNLCLKYFVQKKIFKIGFYSIITGWVVGTYAVSVPGVKGSIGRWPLVVTERIVFDSFAYERADFQSMPNLSVTEHFIRTICYIMFVQCCSLVSQSRWPSAVASPSLHLFGIPLSVDVSLSKRSIIYICIHTIPYCAHLFVVVTESFMHI